MSARNAISARPLRAIAWLAALAFLAGFAGYLALSPPRLDGGVWLAGQAHSALVRPGLASARASPGGDKNAD